MIKIRIRVCLRTRTCIRKQTKVYTTDKRWHHDVYARKTTCCATSITSPRTCYSCVFVLCTAVHSAASYKTIWFRTFSLLRELHNCNRMTKLCHWNGRHVTFPFACRRGLSILINPNGRYNVCRSIRTAQCRNRTGCVLLFFFANLDLRVLRLYVLDTYCF